ncbi:MAG TPA: dihydroorotate dehydrogenase electron transfer subunit [Bacteroidota bacterium]|nr:dihydroorotate dehydrogenase electron transfer subunit [Bacteroidota bacterium]
MLQEQAIVEECREIAEGIYALRFRSPLIAKQARPGQFVNIRVDEGIDPLLRRPFSVSRTVDGTAEVVFNVVGVGTRILSEKRAGEFLDILGPLGHPWEYTTGFDIALIVAGGLGVAPVPILTDFLLREEKNIITFLGARTSSWVAPLNMKNLHIATEDGSKGLRGTVVELVSDYLSSHNVERPKIFGCGPTRMMKALSDLAISKDIPCELLLEGEMACGIGICQGCPVEVVNGEKRYELICTQGPAFDCRHIILPS